MEKYNDLYYDIMSHKRKNMDNNENIYHISPDLFKLPEGHTNDILNYISKNETSAYVIDRIIDIYDINTGFPDCSKYFSIKNYKGLRLKLDMYKLIIKHKGIECLLNMVLSCNNIENYILLLYYAHINGDENTTQIILGSLNEFHTIGDITPIKNIYGKRVSNIPYYTISNLIRLYSTINHIDGSKLKNLRILILSNELFNDNFDANIYVKLFARIWFSDNIIGYGEAMGIEFNLVQFTTMMITTHYRHNKNICDEFIKKLNGYGGNFNLYINRTFNKVSKDYVTLNQFYSILKENGFITSEVINIIYPYFDSYADFYSDKGLCKEFIEKGLNKETVDKRIISGGFNGARYTRNNRYVTGAGKNIRNFRDMFITYRRLLIISKLKEGTK